MENNSSSGLSIAAVLTIIFVVLKLVGVITWSWWWVLSPLIIDIVVSIIIVVCVGAYLARKEQRIYRREKKDKWKF